MNDRIMGRPRALTARAFPMYHSSFRRLSRTMGLARAAFLYGIMSATYHKCREDRSFNFSYRSKLVITTLSSRHLPKRKSASGVPVLIFLFMRSRIKSGMTYKTFGEQKPMFLFTDFVNMNLYLECLSF